MRKEEVSSPAHLLCLQEIKRGGKRKRSIPRLMPQDEMRWEDS